MTYDIIVSGLGCAGFSFMYYLLSSPLKDQKILCIDSSKKDQNDRTWCYWSEDKLDIHPNQSDLVSWKSLKLEGNIQSNISLNKFSYFHIKSSDFYKEMRARIAFNSNITFVNEVIQSVEKSNSGSYIFTTKSNATFEGTTVINSIPQILSPFPEKVMKQEFVGWKIKTKSEYFDPKQMVLMDFEENTQNIPFSFFYILPYSKSEALVEYTTYTKTGVNIEEMKNTLKRYIEKKFSGDFVITFEESGAIPMSTKDFTNSDDPNWINVGTIGGCTKPSTGYTFHTIQKHSKMIVDGLSFGRNKTKLSWNRANRFRFYDNILLNIAAKWPDKLPAIFQEMFSKNSGDQVLKFLNEETRFLEEFNILRKLSFGIFIKSLWNYEKH
ncbi:lycopene cyclase family protein [Belliella sp. R4-6]|uniref:Lycopene cyclase family protein n=1 Tax=Belliella alkalica TaxID=1730871 RepID=A0ABS9V6A4_9BACT|nr:lycopene cyclase family protein [Belliella alkalica]MCH7411952.1 lycopene cyclase family protein [Belliella alkalica]